MCPSDKDLLYVCSKVGVKIAVHDDVYDLIGEISSSSESNDGSSDQTLENYSVNYNRYSNYQVMARTKQTERKEKQGHGGHPIAMKEPAHESGTDSESLIEVASRQQSGMGRSGRSPRKNTSTRFMSDDGSTSGASGRLKQKRVESDSEDDKGTKSGGKGLEKNRKKLPKKPLRKNAPSRKDVSMKELTREWNRTGRVGLNSETAKGWLKKTEKK